MFFSCCIRWVSRDRVQVIIPFILVMIEPYGQWALVQEFLRLLQYKQASLDYLLGRSHLAEGNFEAAKRCFYSAASGIGAFNRLSLRVYLFLCMLFILLLCIFLLYELTCCSGARALPAGAVPAAHRERRRTRARERRRAGAAAAQGAAAAVLSGGHPSLRCVQAERLRHRCCEDRHCRRRQYATGREYLHANAHSKKNTT